MGALLFLHEIGNEKKKKREIFISQVYNNAENFNET